MVRNLLLLEYLNDVVTKTKRLIVVLVIILLDWNIEIENKKRKYFKVLRPF